MINEAFLLPSTQGFSCLQMKVQFGAAQVCDLGSLMLRKLFLKYERICDLRECKIKALKPNRKGQLLRT